MKELIPIAAIAMVFGFGFLRMRQRQRQIEAQTELHKQLIDKFSSGKELSEFVESPGGQRLLDQLVSLDTGTRHTILKGVRVGVVCTLVGVALLVSTRISALSQQQRTGYLVGGIVLLAVGVASLISAAISHRLFLKQDSDRKRDTNAPIV